MINEQIAKLEQFIENKFKDIEDLIDSMDTNCHAEPCQFDPKMAESIENILLDIKYRLDKIERKLK